MDPLMQRFLAGELFSPSADKFGPIGVNNQLPIPLRVGLIGPDGHLYQPFITLVPPFSFGPSFAQGPLNWYHALLTIDGSLAGVYAPGGMILYPEYLCMSGDVGKVPEPTSTILVPNDSPSVLIAAAQVNALEPSPPEPEPSKTYMARSQFWKRSADSITLAPGEEITTSYSSVSGVQPTSSSIETVAACLDVGVPVGWGSIAAAINARFNISSNPFQQYVISETDTRHDSQTYRGEATEAKTIVRWKLMDVLTLFRMSNDNGTYGICAQINVAQHPDIVREYTHPADGPSLAATAGAGEAGEKGGDGTQEEIQQVLQEIHARSSSEEGN